ncbi:low molecular weight phosphatase family protein [Pikeienuella sp. HZG-20]|uniref:arsenate-mycothiol transferase ArsC n=1 Tax=Paludibacillus litoralis TaxID=3133267 RepID=UPI0030EC53EB
MEEAPHGASLPGAVLFCCDHNAVRSPMAEGLAKKLLGSRVFIQSAGVKSEMEVDGFAVEVCREIGVDLSRHRVKSFEDFENWGEDIDSYDLIIALSPAAQLRALEYTRHHAIEVEYWPTLDPTGLTEEREAKLNAYRQTRDQIARRIHERFGG